MSPWGPRRVLGHLIVYQYSTYDLAFLKPFVLPNLRFALIILLFLFETSRRTADMLTCMVSYVGLCHPKVYSLKVTRLETNCRALCSTLSCIRCLAWCSKVSRTIPLQLSGCLPNPSVSGKLDILRVLDSLSDQVRQMSPNELRHMTCSRIRYSPWTSELCFHKSGLVSSTAMASERWGGALKYL